MVFLENQYLNDGIKRLDLVKTELKLLLLEGTAGDEFQEDRDRSEWSKWIEEKVVEAIYNPTMMYDVVNPGDARTSGGKPQLLEKLENWKRGVLVAKGTSTHNLPSFIEKQMAEKIAIQGRQGVIWLTKNAEIIPLDAEIFQGSYRVVRRVTIHGASFIPNYMEFVGKTMKARNSLEN